MPLKYYVKGRKTSEDAAIAIERVYTASWKDKNQQSVVLQGVTGFASAKKLVA